MNGKQAVVTLSVIALATLGGLGTAVAAGEPRDNQKSRDTPSVMPCSLVGVNPAYHPEIFGSAATAREYGFVRGRDGTWQVAPNCRH
jgi:hypothetical protein